MLQLLPGFPYAPRPELIDKGDSQEVWRRQETLQQALQNAAA